MVGENFFRQTEKRACIILAAGERNSGATPTGLVADHLMTIINSKPAFEWVIGEVMGSVGQIIVVTNMENHELNEFISQKRLEKDVISHIKIENSKNILESLECGLKYVHSETNRVIVLLGDTIVKVQSEEINDEVFVSVVNDSYNQWCIAEVEGHRILRFIEKQEKKSAGKSYAVSGRYHFSDKKLLEILVREGLRQQLSELSQVLALYNLQKPLEAVIVESRQWIDFGHLEGFAKARRLLIQSRIFNQLQVDPVYPVITKRTSNIIKLSQEFYWYNELPLKFQSLVPRILDFRKNEEYAEMEMEFYGYENLASKYVHLELSDAFWWEVLNRIFLIVQDFRLYRKPKHDITGLSTFLIEKTMCRIKQVLVDDSEYWKPLLCSPRIRINGKSVKPWERIETEILDLVQKMKTDSIISIVHGDLCFNNILFDPASGAIKLIDPRGSFGGTEPTLFGDPRYDVAKLRHSFCGGYDHIIEKQYRLSESTSLNFDFQIRIDSEQSRIDIFESLVDTYGYISQEIRLIEGMHFLTMVPLHADDKKRQLAFYLKALLIFNSFLN